MGQRTTRKSLGFTGPQREQWSGRVTLGASGAVVAATSLLNSPDTTCVKTGTGAYTLTFTLGSPDWEIFFQVKSAAGTIRRVYIVTESPTTGVVTIITENAGGTATDGAAGDVIFFQVIGRKFGLA